MVNAQAIGACSQTISTRIIFMWTLPYSDSEASSLILISSRVRREAAQDGRIDPLSFQRRGNQAHCEADQISSHDPDDNRAKELHTEGDSVGGDGLHDLVHVHIHF